MAWVISPWLNMKSIHVVAAVIGDAGELLCVQRGPNKYPYIHLKWEFPGGKVEAGESAESALQREIAEELGVKIRVHQKLMTVNHAYPDFTLQMDAYSCSLDADGKRSDLSLAEHINSRWLRPEDPEFAQIDWAAADLPIVSLLRKP